MRSIEAILHELDSAKAKHDYELCITLCREGARLCGSPTQPNWYAFRINLAQYLLTDARSIAGDDVEEAIDVYLQIIDGLRKVEEAKHRAAAAMGLGFAYYLRTRGDVNENLKNSVRVYSQALGFYSRQTDPYTWASIKAAIGLAYSEMSDERAESWLHESIENYKQAREILNQSDYPEDWEEINDKLRDLKDRARDNEQ